jgi:hypothetical protein
MASLTRVPGPRSPFEGRSGRVVAIVLVGIGLAIAKPWNGPAADAPRPLATAIPGASAQGPVSAPAAATRAYDPAGFGRTPPEPAWQIRLPDGATAVGFNGPPATDGGTHPDTGSGGGDANLDPNAAPTIGGPVIDLGSSDDLTAFGINRPLGTTLAAVRLWRFRDGEWPERVQLTEMPRPWSVDHVRVYARRDARLAPGTVLAWPPGLYRLDLLVDPAARNRSLLFVVREGVEPLPAELREDETATVDLAVLGRLPEAATFWAYGSYLTGWAERQQPGDCRIADLWRSSDIDDPCHAISVGRPWAIGVNLPEGTSVSEMRLRAVDPLPGPVEVELRRDVIGRAGLAYVSTAREVLPDGIYRLDVEASSGTFRWYVETGARSIQWGNG